MTLDFLEKLNYLMKEYHLNKSTLSKACDIPYTTIDGWYKKGYEGLKLTTLRKLAKFFNTTLDYWANNENTELYNIPSGTSPYLPFEINTHETVVITAYHNQPEMQPAVDKLLGVENDIGTFNNDAAKLELSEELSPPNAEIEKHLAAYRLELEAEQRGTTSSASTALNVNKAKSLIKKAN